MILVNDKEQEVYIRYIIGKGNVHKITLVIISEIHSNLIFVQSDIHALRNIMPDTNDLSLVPFNEGVVQWYLY